MVCLQITGFLQSACHTSGRVFPPDLRSMTDELRFGTCRPPKLFWAITNLLYQSTQRQATLPQFQSYQQPQEVVSQPNPAPNYYSGQQPSGQPYNHQAPNQQGDASGNYKFHNAWLFCPTLKPIITLSCTVHGCEMPKTEDTVKFCVSHQFKGECKTNCEGQATHRVLFEPNLHASTHGTNASAFQ